MDLPSAFGENTCLFALPLRTVLHNRYEIKQVIGSGGFSVTYQATDLLLGGSVAVKELFPQSCAERSWPNPAVITRGEENRKRFQDALVRFREEARLTASFQGRHNIVSVIDFCEENGTAYLVMEFLDGMTLEEYLRSLPGGRIENLSDAGQIAGAVAESLAYIHKQGVLHRDISPNNIFLHANGSVTVIDFGAARRMGRREEAPVVVKTGCTPPEQYQKNGKQGIWTDLYAWGAVVYRMLTGVFPDPAPDRLRGREEQIPPVSRYHSAVPEYIDRLVERCLALDCRLRPGSADEIQSVLHSQRLLKSPGAVSRERQRRRALIFTAAAFFAVLLAAAGIFLARGTDDLYHAAISACVLEVKMPEGLSSPEGFAALKADFEEMYPQIDLRISNEEAAALFPGTDGGGRERLTELRHLRPEGGEYEQIIAYDATLLYGNGAKTAAFGIDGEPEPGSIPDDLLAASYQEFIDPDNTCAFYFGSISAYRQIQRDLAGFYTVCGSKVPSQAVDMCVSDGLDSNTRLAAMRLLLYLTSQRAQEILFVEHGGLLPADEAARETYFKVNDELSFLKD